MYGSYAFRQRILEQIKTRQKKATFHSSDDVISPINSATVRDRGRIPLHSGITRLVLDKARKGVSPYLSPKSRLRTMTTCPCIGKTGRSVRKVREVNQMGTVTYESLNGFLPRRGGSISGV